MNSNHIVIAALLAAFVIGHPARAYPSNLSEMLGSKEQNPDTFKVIRVADLKALRARLGNNVHVYDANGGVTREKFGIIPGATLLSSYDDYSLSVLPPDRQAILVFYCADQR